ncbi:MAG: gluconate 2-dehydrogenase subunit 3 family protein [Bacteroidales bacterium]|nr:gluconate 2-dehydrogenase subunit 3 family protein [Bacteroidales bacterium]
MKRRRFVSFIGIAGIGVCIAPISCNIVSKNAGNQLTELQAKNLRVLLSAIFPEDENGPNANDIGAFDYIVNLIEYRNQADNLQTWFFQGLDDIEDLTQEIIDKSFFETIAEQQKVILEKMIQSKQGEDFLSELINLLLESLLSPPIYTDNQNVTVWQWLEVFQGNPQPKKEEKFPEILIQYGLK